MASTVGLILNPEAVGTLRVGLERQFVSACQKHEKANQVVKLLLTGGTVVSDAQKTLLCAQFYQEVQDTIREFKCIQGGIQTMLGSGLMEGADWPRMQAMDTTAGNALSNLRMSLETVRTIYVSPEI